jgi:hypothetical protein
MKQSKTKRSKQNYLAQNRRTNALLRQQSESDLARFHYYGYCKLHCTQLHKVSGKMQACSARENCTLVWQILVFSSLYPFDFSHSYKRTE